MQEIMNFITGATYQETIINMMFLFMAFDGVILLIYVLLKGIK